VRLTREWVAGTAGGAVVGGDVPAGHGVAFDSRTIRPGEVFAALRDARDGHDYVADALDRGAAFAIVERPVDDHPVVVVPDVRDALYALTRAARSTLDAHVVGITGSVGKTSTKDLTAAALGAGLRTHAAPASFNNEIGVPVTVLGAPDDTEALVVEMGARFPGNIAELCELVHPQVGIITNIGIVHAEHLGGPDGVARVKGELLEALPADGLAVISAECERSVGERHRTGAAVVTVGSDADADVRVSDVTLDAELRPTFTYASPWGSGEITLAVRGAHQVVNAAQAATVALHAGVAFAEVAGALAVATGSAWRMEVIDRADGVRVLNDAYNSSPVAAVAALDALAAIDATGRRIAVLGEMRELGDLSESEHARVGRHVATAGIDVLIAVGGDTDPLAAAAAAARPELLVERVPDVEAARSRLEAIVDHGDVVLVKASRAVGLERLVVPAEEGVA
jgi:UDP-N-acetylmuramoyl-tripeptide--D-alanyl-D-alanine ligase